MLRLAKLSLDADEPTDPEVLATAGAYAIGCSDNLLGERLSRAAIAAGGGFDARFCLATR